MFLKARISTKLDYLRAFLYYALIFIFSILHPDTTSEMNYDQ